MFLPSPNPAPFCYERARFAPYELTHVRASSGDCAAGWAVRGRKPHARFESSRLWQSSRQWRAVPCSCIDAARGRRLLRRSFVNILTAWPGRVAQAPRAGRARAPWSCSPYWRPSREPHGWGTSYSSTTYRTRKSPIATTRAAQLAVCSSGQLAPSKLIPQ